MRRLTGERHVETRRLLWMFPVEFATLRSNASYFVGQLFQRNSFQETPAFRGVYFTSGTQNARPMSRVLQSMASSFGMRLPGPIGAAIEPKSFFLTDVFRKVIFPDQLLAGQTESEKRRRLLVRLAVAAVCLFMGGCLDLPGVLTFAHNRQLVQATVETANRIESAKWADTGTLDTNVPTLDAAEQQLRQLADWNENGAPSRCVGECTKVASSTEAYATPTRPPCRAPWWIARSAISTIGCARWTPAQCARARTSTATSTR